MKQNNRTICTASKRGQLLIDRPTDVRLNLGHSLNEDALSLGLFVCYLKYDTTERVTEFYCVVGLESIVLE